MSRAREIVRRLVPVLAVLLLAVALSAWLVSTRPEPERRPPRETAALVEIIVLEPGDRAVTVTGYGEVAPSVQVSLQAEASGRVVWLNDRLTDGGLVREGEPILTLDDREYRLAVSERLADVRAAGVRLREEQARARVARRERELLGELGQQAAESDLARRQPQLEAAQAALAAARSGLERARLNLERTELRSPFTALVRGSMVDVGQLVAPQVELATLVGVDAFWVRATLQVSDALLVTQGSSARISSAHARNPPSERRGVVLRLSGDVEPVGRMARVLVEVPDPLALAPDAREELSPLLLGSFVDVEIDARVFRDVFSLPLVALRRGDRVYLQDEDGRLRVKDVRVLWREADFVLVGEELSRGERLVVSPLPGAVEGMLVRANDEDGD